MNLVKWAVHFTTSFGMISVTGILKWRSFHLYGEDEAAKKTTRSILAYVLDQHDAFIASIHAIYYRGNLAEPST